ncbi:hypothetical protein ElyMa_002378500 [Elysia marginata]|uniref:Uncharacterized protein n=1 Tax=Elysia marginata TaxID=1093978 RepID=A0AAV4GDD2_9GAST|nr:hypothetical protein ElyMa_002378500 [Elysia marginata]
MISKRKTKSLAEDLEDGAKRSKYGVKSISNRIFEGPKDSAGGTLSRSYDCLWNKEKPGDPAGTAISSSFDPKTAVYTMLRGPARRRVRPRPVQISRAVLSRFS